MRHGRADDGGAGAGAGGAVAVSPKDFREALARWASGVTVVTARDAHGPVGMTAASFSSLSLEPPLVLVCVAHEAMSHDGLVGAEGFVVHVLGRDQQHLSERFAEVGSEKFAAIEDERGPFDAPLLPLGVARIACARESLLRGGDHTILVGRVVATDLGDAEPLVYCDRAYWGLADGDRPGSATAT